ncbi:hypothetical protein [Streptomyces sp. NPDC055105]|uniref:hypothetical protein n=1 Tax=Streptomyces sp. NPDC055105 TaxID=3365719 RepID=UPI0037D9144C
MTEVSTTAPSSWPAWNPITYVASGERDVPTRLNRELHRLARPVSRGFSIEDSPRAEHAVQEALAGGAGGRRLRCAHRPGRPRVLRLLLDYEAIAHRRKQRRLRYETDLLDPTHEFRLRQTRQQHERKVLRPQQDQELVSAKINFYRYWLQHGGVEAWALDLRPAPRRHAAGRQRHPEGPTLAHGRRVGTDRRGLAEDFQKAESALALLPAVNDLIEQRPPAPAGQVVAPGHPHAPRPRPVRRTSPSRRPRPSTGRPTRPPGRPPRCPRPPARARPPHGGHAWAGLPGYWHSLPGRIAGAVTLGLSRVTLAVARRFSLAGTGRMYLS